MVDTIPSEPAVTSIWVTIDHDRSFEQMIAVGHYPCRVHPDITSLHFPKIEDRIGTEQVEVLLVHLKRDLSTDEVLVHLDSLDLTPAYPIHLLAVGEQIPDLQREYSIVELGQTWQREGVENYRVALCLSGTIDKRNLSPIWIATTWYRRVRFLALRKKSCVLSRS